jgi:uncharacterized protein (TIGR00369 family)
VTTLQRIDAARASGDWNQLVHSLPYAQFLGISAAVEKGRLVSRMKFGDHLVGNPTIPALHGGTLGALMEVTAQLEMLFRAETVLLPKTITLTIDYLRSGKPVETFASAQIARQGRRVATVRVAAWQEDEAKPIATTTLQVLILGS